MGRSKRSAMVRRSHGEAIFLEGDRPHAPFSGASRGHTCCTTSTTLKHWRRRRSRRGSAVVEVLVIVAIVLTLGLLAMTTIGSATTTGATREADCIRTFACGPGN